MWLRSSKLHEDAYLIFEITIAEALQVQEIAYHQKLRDFLLT